MLICTLVSSTARRCGVFRPSCLLFLFVRSFVVRYLVQGGALGVNLVPHVNRDALGFGVDFVQVFQGRQRGLGCYSQGIRPNGGGSCVRHLILRFLDLVWRAVPMAWAD